MSLFPLLHLWLKFIFHVDFVPEMTILLLNVLLLTKSLQSFCIGYFKTLLASSSEDEKDNEVTVGQKVRKCCLKTLRFSGAPYMNSTHKAHQMEEGEEWPNLI
ncbi:hypothetical protein Q9966_001817 [Columba livia]|nr:hypothetical protein Q9966_001817 [Columba livia]